MGFCFAEFTLSLQLVWEIRITVSFYEYFVFGRKKRACEFREKMGWKTSTIMLHFHGLENIWEVMFVGMVNGAVFVHVKCYFWKSTPFQHFRAFVQFQFDIGEAVVLHQSLSILEDAIFPQDSKRPRRIVLGLHITYCVRHCGVFAHNKKWVA